MPPNPVYQQCTPRPHQSRKYLYGNLSFIILQFQAVAFNQL
jgi:hypothetical protein